MSTQYGCIAFTDDVRRTQQHYGSAEFYTRVAERGSAAEGPDPLGPREKKFLGERDGFYLATVGSGGWPYVQFRGGRPGFIKTLDPNTIGWADFQGNLQHVSTGNLVGDERVAFIAVDYLTRRRLKLFGTARVVRTEDEPDLVASLAVKDYDAVIEAAIVVTVAAYDWNCPQHIPRRLTVDQVEERLIPLRDRIAELEAENATLRSQAH
ncbi:putative pyridoxine 5'-phosphate oxidase superfamily flavin-nucleotide-binding protein [Mycetocola sp. CAN_C7]|uniref:pyridoxamine 5'-phosphate oxidase family protein n=1 Tax=Mycetocola sp. CAN_C7 TaxID=2787724 RepID=UPI0018CA1EA7